MKIFKVYSWCSNDYYETAEYCKGPKYFARLEAAQDYANGVCMEAAELCAVHNVCPDFDDTVIDRDARRVEFTDNMWDSIALGVEIDEIDVTE